jgi:hypothetical protein
MNNIFELINLLFFDLILIIILFRKYDNQLHINCKNFPVQNLDSLGRRIHNRLDKEFDL